MQTIAALARVKAAGLAIRIPDLFLGITEPAKAGKRNGLRDAAATHTRSRCWITTPASAAASPC